MTDNTTISIDFSLSSLLPSPYLLVYSIPLLLTSFLLAFAGAFLTLDRTCTFAPQAPTESNFSMTKSKRWWGLEGGVGGLASGWAFGAHLSTFLSLIIMNRTTKPHLSPVQFLVIHLVSSFLCTFLTGRFKIAALVCIGIAGGVSLSLVMSVILHPSLLTRLIFVAILSPFILVATVLPIPRTQHCAVRLASSSMGAFGTVVAIALLARIPAWADVWERLWMNVSLQNHWGTSAERGLSAAAFIIFVCGTVSDWFLRRQFGENPDQKWDSYLAQYAASLPNAADRAGTFKPLPSFWQRLFHLPSSNLIFPSDKDLESKHSSALVGPQRLLPKHPTVKFQPLGGYSDSESDDTDCEPEFEAKGQALQSSTGLPRVASHGSDDETLSKTRNKKIHAVDDAVVYSDSESEGITAPHSVLPTRKKSTLLQKSRRDEPGWKPDFLMRHVSLSPTNTSSATAVSLTRGPRDTVPMPPSLIRAIDRIGIAQNGTYGHASPPPLSLLPRPKPGSKEEWQNFWGRIQHKVGGA